MTKKELIEKLFEEFEKDKDTIRDNLLLALDTVCLSTSDGTRKVVLQIKIEEL